MTNACCTPTIIRLHRPRFLRWAECLRLRLQAALAGATQRRGRDLEALERLSPHTLRDIGAPEWVQVRARARHASRLEALHRWCDGPHPHDIGRW